MLGLVRLTRNRIACRKWTESDVNLSRSSPLPFSASCWAAKPSHEVQTLHQSCRNVHKLLFISLSTDLFSADWLFFYFSTFFCCSVSDQSASRVPFTHLHPPPTPLWVCCTVWCQSDSQKNQMNQFHLNFTLWAILMWKRCLYRDECGDGK